MTSLLDLGGYNAALAASRAAYNAEQHCPCGVLTGTDASRRGVLCEACKDER